MAEMTRARLVALPALITLAVTLLRLVGELQHWSPVLFRRDPGGLGAVIGIIWLAPIFGVYFALKLVEVGAEPASVKRTIAHALAGVGLFVGWSLIALTFIQPAAGTVGKPIQFQAQVIGTAIVELVIVLLLLRAWAALSKVLLLYSVAARLPVVMVMLCAIFGNWGTHYDAFPVGFPLTSALERWFWGGLLVQMTVHTGNTVLLGSLFGGIAVAVGHRKRMNPHVA